MGEGRDDTWEGSKYCFQGEVDVNEQVSMPEAQGAMGATIV